MTYKRFTVSCVDCKKELATIQLSKHIDSKSCKSNLEIIPKTPKIFSKICIYCGILTTNKRHETLCQLNPNKKSPKNQYTKARDNGTEYSISDDTRAKLVACNTGRIHKQETIEKLKVSMQKAVLDNPESYNGRFNRGFVKEIICSNGFKVLGSWEASFVEFCISHNIILKQPKIPFDYIYENRSRKYFPDFYLKEYNTYVEIKGYKTAKDVAKWEYFTNKHKNKLLIIDKSNIKNIKNDTISIEELLKSYIFLGLDSNQ